MPASMMFLWALCGVPFGVYAIVQNFNIPYVVPRRIAPDLETRAKIPLKKQLVDNES